MYSLAGFRPCLKSKDMAVSTLPQALSRCPPWRTPGGSPVVGTLYSAQSLRAGIRQAREGAHECGKEAGAFPWQARAGALLFPRPRATGSDIGRASAWQDAASQQDDTASARCHLCLPLTPPRHHAPERCLTTSCRLARACRPTKASSP